MDPYTFDWSVDQDGYVIEHRSHPALFFTPAREYDAVSRCGGPDRFYRALDIEGLWLRCAETCRTREGVLNFANEFGLLSGEKETPLGDFFSLAHRLSEIDERLRARDQKSAALVFHRRDNPLLPGWPLVYGAVLPSAKRPGGSEWRLIPSSLRDALLLQAAEAITGNRTFRRCRNDRCPNWFRLGPRSAADGGKTYTQRREFCSDRCRVAWARRQKRGASAHA